MRPRLLGCPVEVFAREDAVTVVAALVSALTDAVAAVSGEGCRDEVRIELIGQPASRRGLGGKVVGAGGGAPSLQVRTPAWAAPRVALLTRVQRGRPTTLFTAVPTSRPTSASWAWSAQTVAPPSGTERRVAGEQGACRQLDLLQVRHCRAQCW
jgi:hypothetical protein